MAYLFDVDTEQIAVSALTTWTTKFSLAVRIKPTTADTSQRCVVVFAGDPLFVDFTTTATNQIRVGWQDSGSTYRLAGWTTGFAAGTTHVVTFVVDTTAAGNNKVKIYADADASPKALADNPDTTTWTLGPLTAATTGLIGSAGTTLGVNSTLYELAYWPQVALTGAQAAALGATGQMASGFPLPTHYWPMVSDATDLYGGSNGTVTGATVVSHTGGSWFPAASGPVTYYVKTGGNDSADGLSDGAAWATVTKVNATTLIPGDTVQFHGGDTFTGTGLAPTLSGADPDNPVTFCSYGTGKATITPAAGTSGFLGNGLQCLDLTDLIFQSADNLATQTVITRGIVIYNDGASQLAHVYIDGCEAYDFSWDGIFVGGTGGYDDIRITNCLATGNQQSGITVYATTGSPVHTNVYVADCVATDNPGTPTGAPISAAYGFGILLCGTTGGVLERCLAARNGTNSDGGPVGILVAYCSGVTVQYCESYDNSCLGNDGDGIDCDHGATNCLVQYNYTHGNKAAGFLVFDATSCTYRYNISEDDFRGATDLTFLGACVTDANCQTIDWYGNTVYLTAGVHTPTAFRVSRTNSGIRVFNNVFIVAGSGGKMLDWYVDSLTGAVVNGNAYWQTGDTTTFRATWGASTYTSLAAFRTGTSQETGTGYNVDPEVTNPGTAGTIGSPTTVAALREGCKAYRLAPGSWAQGAGLDLDAYSITSPGTVDFFGLTLPLSGLTTLGASLAAAMTENEKVLLLLAGHAEARV